MQVKYDDVFAVERTQNVGTSKTLEDDELENLYFMSEIKPGEPVDMTCPTEVVSMGYGTVILVDQSLNYLQKEYSKSVCVFGDCLFVATKDPAITKMSLSGSSCNTNYKPDGVRKIDYISAIGDNVVLMGW